MSISYHNDKMSIMLAAVRLANEKRGFEMTHSPKHCEQMSPVHSVIRAGFVLAMVMVVACVIALARPSFALAETCGDFEVDGGTYGVDYTYESNVLSVKSSTSLTIAMRAGVSRTDNRIEVENESANITLNEVDIDVSSAGEAALRVSSGSLTLALTESNSLVSGTSHAGLELGSKCNLVLSAGINASLFAQGGSNGAGIGSGSAEECGSITINGGTVVAQGGASAAGIGGAYYGASCGLITINGGSVTATGGNGGGGAAGVGKDGGAAGIGSGARSTAQGVVISGGTVNATGGSTGVATTNAGGAGIGTGYDGVMGNDAITGGASILISGGNVTAQGGMSAAGIGSAAKSNAVYGSVSITGGTLDAHAGAGSSAQAGAAGIGCGYDKGSVSSGGSVVSSIVISGGIVKAVSTGDGRAIGEATSSKVGSVSISGGSITASTGAGGLGVLHKDTVITGGLFADTSVSAIADNVVYGVTAASGYAVRANADPVTSATYPIGVATVSDFIVTGGVYGTDYTYENNVLSIKSGTPLTIAMKEDVNITTVDHIAVAAGDFAAEITLSGVNIDASNRSAAAIDVPAGATLKLILAKGTDSQLKGAFDYAAISVPMGATLEVAGEGALKATGGTYAAGIGGNTGKGTGKDPLTDKGGITIAGGTVDSFGEFGAAGIGGGTGGIGANITVSGGTVRAKSNGEGAGIGGGNAASGRAITVSGGYISVEGAAGAEGFGSGKGGAARSLVSITGGLFAEAAAADGSIYGVMPASASSAMANLDGNTKNVYPTLVLPVAQIEDPIIQLNASTVYTGTAITPGDVIKSAAYGSIDAKNAVALEFVGGDVPVAVGEYKVSASLAAKQDGVLDAATAALTGTYYRAATIDQIFEITPRSSDPTVLASTGDNPTGPVALLGIVVCVAAVTILATRRRIR